MAIGDHIKVRRLLGFYYHHGIDVGDGTVIHFTGDPKRKKDAIIEKTTLDEFSKGKPIKVVDYSKIISNIKSSCPRKTKNERFRAEESISLDSIKEIRIEDLIDHINDTNETVRLALEYAGKTGYDLFFNNCEHFATYCKTGIEHSEQMESLLYSMRIHSRFMREPLHIPRWFR